MTTKNPWLGLASYEEPKNDGNDYSFCGRDQETLDLVRLIDNNLFVTLYGSSGIGKTSLLRAGVSPILRRKGYFPIYVRLAQESQELPYAAVIVNKLHESGLKEDIFAEMEHPNSHDRQFLWEYFATTRFLKDDREVYPVIILDQFEEVFREDDKAKAELLMHQIYLLINDELEVSEESGYSSDTNYRFAASIREDFLFVLEDCIDANSLELFKNNRYRLRPMKPEQAREVVLGPGKDCIEEAEREAIIERILTLSKRPQSNDIDTLLLSLVCSGTYDKKAGARITLSDLAIWKDNPMEVYYQDAIKGLTPTQINYIQQRLIRDDGSRRRVDEEEVITALGKDTFQQLSKGSNRILSIGDKKQVELLHDQIAKAIYDERMERQKKQIFLQRFFTNGIFDGLVLAFDLFVLTFMIAGHQYVGFYRLYILIFGSILILSTYMQNVTRTSHDNRVDAFIFPQLSTSLLLYYILHRDQLNLYAFHTIKPSTINNLLNIFLWLNIALACISIITRLFFKQDYRHNQTRWIDFLSFKRKENRFAQISLLTSIIITTLILLAIPDTHPERLRKLAKNGDTNAMIELGNYYMKYDRDVERAREWYYAAAEDHDVSDLINKTYEYPSLTLSDSMKIEATTALLSNYSFENMPTASNILENKYWSFNGYDIIDYYDSINNPDAVIRWYSFLAQLTGMGYYGGLGYEFWRGEYVEQDMERAFELYLKGKSHNNVVQCYIHGWGVEQSFQKAREYIEEERCQEVIHIGTLLLLGIPTKSK